MLEETTEQSGLYRAMESMMGLPAGEIRGDQQLTELKGWDSLAILEFMLLAGSDYGADLQPDEIAACTTVRDLAHVTLNPRTLAA